MRKIITFAVMAFLSLPAHAEYIKTAPVTLDNISGGPLSISSGGTGATSISASLTNDNGIFDLTVPEPRYATGETDTILTTDCGKAVSYSNAAGTAVTINAASTYGNGCGVTLNNDGTSDVVATLSSGTIGGQSSLTVPPSTGCQIFVASDSWKMDLSTCSAQSYNTLFSASAVNFTLTSSVPPTLLSGRNTAATYLDASGYVQSANAYVPRIDHDATTHASLGLLNEPGSATNAALYSAGVYSHWSSSNGTMTSYGSSIGLFSDIAVIPSGGAVWHRASTSATIVAGQTYAWTAYVIPGTSGKVSIEVRANSQSSQIYGTIGSSLSSTYSSANGTLYHDGTLALGGGVYKLWGHITSTYGGSGSFGIGAASTTVGQTVIVLGGQIELGTTPSSFIVTQGSPVTRSADVFRFVNLFPQTTATYTFDDDSTQTSSMVVGLNYVPSNLNRSHIKSIVGSY